jgi:hypothetical protein
VDDGRESLPPGTLPEIKKKKAPPAREALRTPKRTGA